MREGLIAEILEGLGSGQRAGKKMNLLAGAVHQLLQGLGFSRAAAASRLVGLVLGGNSGHTDKWW